MATVVSTTPAQERYGSIGIKVKTRPLRVRRGGCFQVLMRNAKPGPRHGQWEAIATNGFVVVCPSRYEACELIWMVGGRLFPRPVHLIQDRDGDEERYLDWLLEHHFRIDPLHRSAVGPFDDEGVCGRRLQVMFSTFLKGWYPGARDVLPATSMAASLIQPALRSRWQGR